MLTIKELKMTNRIKEFRARHNLTQDELAKKVNVRRENNCVFGTKQI